MKKSLLLLLFVFGFVQLNFAQETKAETKYTKFPVDVRTGPGAYYDFVSRIFANAEVHVLAKDGSWQEIKMNEIKGWVPASALSDTQKGKSAKAGKASDRMNQFFDEMGTVDTTKKQNLSASKAEVAAAVKGFARKYKASKGQSTNVNLTSHFENRINWSEYKAFRKSRIADVFWYHRKENLSLRDSDAPNHDPTLDQAGFAIASVVANSGLYTDRPLLEYVNYMALFMVESSHHFETPVQVHILDTEDVLGFAVPGGYIFISKGALRLMESEAELAHFLAHEIAHLTFEHGLQEYEKRRPRIHSAKAFEELDTDLAMEDSTKFTSVDEELSDWTDEVYEYISKPRLEDYEVEADYWGMVYAYRGGYAPEDAIDYLNRMKIAGGNFSETRGKLEWTGTPLEKRIKALQRSLKKLGIKGGDTYRKEFLAMKRRLN